MGIRPPETEGADSDGPGALPPRFGGDGDIEGVAIEAAVWMGRLESSRGGDHPSFEGEDDLGEGRSPGTRLEVAEVPLEGGDGQWGTAPSAEGAHRLDLGPVPHRGAGAVCLDESEGLGIDSRILPGPLDRDDLAGGIGRGDPLPPAVTGGTGTEDDRPDALSVAQGIRETPQDEDRSPLTHDEAIRTAVEGEGAVPAQGAEATELRVRGDPHVAIDPAREDPVRPSRAETVDRRGEGDEGTGAGGIDGEVRPAQIEGGGDPACHDVGEFPRHRILPDLRQGKTEPLQGEFHATVSLEGIEHDPGRGPLPQIVSLRHSEDHIGSPPDLRVLLRIPRIGQGRGRGFERGTLVLVEQRYARRWNPEAPRRERAIGEECPKVRVATRGIRAGGVEEARRRPDPIGDLRDRHLPCAQEFPESLLMGLRTGEEKTHSHDRHGATFDLAGDPPDDLRAVCHAGSRGSCRGPRRLPGAGDSACHRRGDGGRRIREIAPSEAGVLPVRGIPPRHACR